MAKKGQAHYSLEDKARALAEYRLTGSYSRAARLVGCSPSQVIEWDKALSEIDRDLECC